MTDTTLVIMLLQGQMAAVFEHEYWLLGLACCRHAVCAICVLVLQLA